MLLSAELACLCALAGKGGGGGGLAGAGSTLPLLRAFSCAPTACACTAQRLLFSSKAHVLDSIEPLKGRMAHGCATLLPGTPQHKRIVTGEKACHPG